MIHELLTKGAGEGIGGSKIWPGWTFVGKHKILQASALPHACLRIPAGVLCCPGQINGKLPQRIAEVRPAWRQIGGRLKLNPGPLARPRGKYGLRINPGDALSARYEVPCTPQDSYYSLLKCCFSQIINSVQLQLRTLFHSYDNSVILI